MNIKFKLEENITLLLEDEIELNQLNDFIVSNFFNFLL